MPSLTQQKTERLLKRAGIKNELTPEQLIELWKCVRDPLYFIENYVKIVHPDLGIVPFELYPYQKKIVQSMHDNRNTIIATSRQVGKMEKLDQPIPLFKGGFTTMGQLNVGDIIIDADGKPTKVTFKTPIQHLPCYRITFDDGTISEIGQDHLWEVVDRFNLHKKSVLSTKDLYQSGWSRVNKTTGYTENRWYIPNTKPVDYSRRDQQIDPYVLGIWLGDGTSTSHRFTCSIDDLHHYEEQGVRFGKNYCRNQKPNQFEGPILNFTNDDLRSYNLLENKHIPADYLYGSVEQRTALVQGLWDTDGFIEKNGLCCIQLAASSINLIDDIQQLLCSLGLKVFRSRHTDRRQDKDSIRLAFKCGKDYLRVSRIQRKDIRQVVSCKNARYSLSRTIQLIEPIDSVPAQCIEVDNQRHLYLTGRQYLPTHNTTSAVGYCLWYVIFNANKTCAIVANKGDTSKKVLASIKDAYIRLPKWIQHGVDDGGWNKETIRLENGSKIISAATSSDTVRGETINLLIVDEAAHIENWDEFWKSVSPTISASKTSKVVLISTPNGLNHFHTTWSRANMKPKKNNYNPIKVMWYEAPGRDEEWKKKILETDLNNDMAAFEQEYCVEFLGSSGTLISGPKLRQLNALVVDYQPILKDETGLRQYQKVVEGHSYVIICDVSRGKLLDYSAFHVIDVTKVPYQQVCTYRNNAVTPTDYAAVIYRIGTYYNHAHALVEINDLGGQVVDALHDPHEYESILYTTTKGSRTGKTLSTGFGNVNRERGIRTTEPVKGNGCAMLKLLIEQDKLEIFDKPTVDELNTFSQKDNGKYAAEPGNHDDLVMGLVLFGWLSDQKYFKELTDTNIAQALREFSEEQMNVMILPYGYHETGLEPEEEEPFDFSQQPMAFSWF